VRNQTSMLLGSEGKDDGSARGKHVVVLEAFLTRARLTRSKVGGWVGR